MKDLDFWIPGKNERNSLLLFLLLLCFSKSCVFYNFFSSNYCDTNNINYSFTNFGIL